MHPQSSLLKKHVEVLDDEGDVDCVPIVDNETSIIQEATIVDLDDDEATLPSECPFLPVSLPLSTVEPSARRTTNNISTSLCSSISNSQRI
ncbi:hypothetical protein RCL1_005888 [Eukaryota sp. TZLM3-RCL]